MSSKFQLHAGLASLALCGLTLGFAVQPAAGQLEPYSAGRMIGSTINRGQQNNQQNRRVIPAHGYNGGVRFIPGSGYYCNGNPVVFINGSPCYVPGYYYSGTYSGYGFGINGYGTLTQGYMGTIQPGYGGYGYQGNYAPPVVENNYTYNQNYNQPPPVVDQNVNQNYQNTRQTNQAPAKRKAGTDDSDEYYLHRKPTPQQKDPSLSQAVTDIENAFRTGNTASLERHIDVKETLTLQIKDTNRKPLPAADYLAMTRDALKVMNTVEYKLNHVEPASNGAMMVYGNHVVRGDQGVEKVFNVGFILQKRGETWMITEVSAEPAK
jgi:hypothetical protein